MTKTISLSLSLSILDWTTKFYLFIINSIFAEWQEKKLLPFFLLMVKADMCVSLIEKITFLSLLFLPAHQRARGGRRERERDIVFFMRWFRFAIINDKVTTMRTYIMHSRLVNISFYWICKQQRTRETVKEIKKASEFIENNKTVHKQNTLQIAYKSICLMRALLPQSIYRIHTNGFLFLRFIQIFSLRSFYVFRFPLFRPGMLQMCLAYK